MIRIYRATDLPQAYLMLRRLEDAGIPAKVFNENAQGALGEIPFIHVYPEIWLVRENDATRARKLLQDFEETMRSPVANVTCPHCRETNPENFETCWNCGQVIH